MNFIDLIKLSHLAAVFLLVVLAEMGDKTKLATFNIAAKYQSPISVLIGTNLRHACG
jgi:putative Ca2+/H+ antiporter (TMEM165/GDT1 family)